MPGYTGKPIYLCSESLTAKKTYGTSQWPFTCHGDITYEYKEGLCPRAEDTLKHLVCIPLDESWTIKDVERAVAAIGKSLSSTISGTTAAHNNGTARSAVTQVEEAGKTIRIGIVGCGQIGRWHLDSYKKNPHAKVVAVSDSDFSRAQAFAKEINAKHYSSHAEMIANEALDGVSLCTIPSTHKEIAIDLLNADVHVLCEKPMAISVDQAEEMTKTAKERKRLLLTAFKFRFFDEVMKAKALLDQGGLGKVLSFRLMFGGYVDMAGTWFVQKKLSGGGVIMDNGPHAVDLVRFLFGEIQSVVAHAARCQNIEVEDTAQMTFHMKNGVIGTADLTWSNSIPARTYLEIYGENGTILLDFEGLSYKFKNWNEWKREPNSVDMRVAFARQISHFVDANTRQGPSRLNGEDGWRSQAAIKCAYQSLDVGRKVEL